MKLTLKIYLFGLIAIVPSAIGGTVYKYLDYSGNVGYGDELPKEALLLDVLTTKEHADRTSLAESNELIDQLSTTTERLKKDRQDRDAARLAEKQAKVAARASYQPPVVYREVNYYPHYSHRVPYHHRRHYRDRPFPDIRKPAHHFKKDYLPRSENRYNGPVLAPRSSLLTP